MDHPYLCVLRGRRELAARGSDLNPYAAIVYTTLNRKLFYITDLRLNS